MPISTTPEAVAAWLAGTSAEDRLRRRRSKNVTTATAVMPATAAPTAMPIFAPTVKSEDDVATAAVGEAERMVVAVALARAAVAVSDVGDTIEEEELVVRDVGVDDDVEDEDDEFALMKNPRLLNLPLTKPTGYDVSPDIPLDSRSANFELRFISAVSMLSPSPTVHW